MPHLMKPDNAFQPQMPSSPRGSRDLSLSSFITALLAIAVSLRILIGQTLLNQYVGYTSGTGFVGGRFHPATYLVGLIIIVYVGSLALLPIRLRRRGGRHIVGLLLAGVAVVIALANGGQNAAASVVDVIIAPLAMAFLLSQLSEEQRTFIFRVVLWLVAFNLVPVVFEKATGIALFPREKTEMFFRPQGYLDHPLVAGVAVFCTMWGVLRLGQRPVIDTLWSGALFLQMLLLGVRLPLVAATILLLLQILKLGRRSSTGKVAAGFFLIAIPPVLFTIAVWLGWLDRFMALGLYDDKSAASRLVAFDILYSLNRSELLHGVPTERVLALMDQFNIAAIENSFVSYTLLGGLWVAILAHLTILIAVFPAIRRDLTFIGLTMVIFIGTIMFAAKATAFMIYLLLSEVVVERWTSE